MPLRIPKRRIPLRCVTLFRAVFAEVASLPPTKAINCLHTYYSILYLFIYTAAQQMIRISNRTKPLQLIPTNKRVRVVQLLIIRGVRRRQLRRTSCNFALVVVVGRRTSLHSTLAMEIFAPMPLTDTSQMHGDNHSSIVRLFRAFRISVLWLSTPVSARRPVVSVAGRVVGKLETTGVMQLGSFQNVDLCVEKSTYLDRRALWRWSRPWRGQ
jgi:hypothetical protein